MGPYCLSVLYIVVCIRLKNFFQYLSFFLIEIYLIYNVVLISDVQQSDSIIHIYSFLYSLSLWIIVRY